MAALQFGVRTFLALTMALAVCAVAQVPEPPARLRVNTQLVADQRRREG
jgi:hypothetical protein